MTWKANQTAIVICDMWNDHYCRNAARRVAEMAPRMNAVLNKARQQGVLIITMMVLWATGWVGLPASSAIANT